MKKQPLDTSRLKALISSDEWCAATARITYEGQPVRLMYREEPINEADSGWQFLDGTETEEYLADPNNAAMYRLNTVANFDAAIIPYLDYPVGTDLERVEGTDEFVKID